MKRFVLMLLVILMAVMPLFAASGEETAAWELCEIGDEIPEEAMSVFTDAMSDFVGVNYTPVSLLAVKNGEIAEYLFLCSGTVVYPGAQPFLAYMFVSGNPGGECTVNFINTFVQYDENFNEVEGWEIVEPKALTVEESGVFEEAIANFVGVGYEPAAVIEKKGETGYLYLCKSVVIYPGAQPYWSYVYVEEDNNGRPMITGIGMLEELFAETEEITDYNPEIRTDAEEYEVTTSDDTEIYICDKIFNEDVYVVGTGCDVWFVNCEFKANIINQATEFTYVWVDETCDIGENTKLIIDSGISEGTDEYFAPKFVIFKSIPVECEGIGGVIMIGTEDIVMNEEVYALQDAQYTVDEEGNLVAFENNFESFSHEVRQWYSNGEKIVLTIAE